MSYAARANARAARAVC